MGKGLAFGRWARSGHGHVTRHLICEFDAIATGDYNTGQIDSKGSGSNISLTKVNTHIHFKSLNTDTIEVKRILELKQAFVRAMETKLGNNAEAIANISADADQAARLHLANGLSSPDEMARAINAYAVSIRLSSPTRTNPSPNSPVFAAGRRLQLMHCRVRCPSACWPSFSGAEDAGERFAAAFALALDSLDYTRVALLEEKYFHFLEKSLNVDGVHVMRGYILRKALMREAELLSMATSPFATHREEIIRMKMSEDEAEHLRGEALGAEVTNGEIELSKLTDERLVERIEAEIRNNPAKDSLLIKCYINAE